MAYVGEPFQHDVFVSYSHGDPDGTGDSRLGRWSRAFARELETELKAYPKFGKDLRVFLDQHHRPSQGLDPLLPLTDQLQEDIAASAILTVLMSPHYLGSEWCGRERDWWCESQRKLELAIDGRIAVARIWETADPWPPALTDPRGEPLLGFWFYDRANAALYPQPYEWPEPGPTSKDPFRKELLTLVGRIGLKLEETRKRLAERRMAREQANKLAAGNGQVVYLHGRAEYDKEWDRAADALSGSGLVVLPASPTPSSTTRAGCRS